MARKAARPQTAARQEHPKKPAPAFWPAFASWLEHRGVAIAIALTAIASVRIALTYTVFSQTFDEPAHIASGMEWLDKAAYRWEPQHPPLARVAAALGPFLSGIRSQGPPERRTYAKFLEGNKILLSGGHYDRTLALLNVPAIGIAYAGQEAASLPRDDHDRTLDMVLTEQGIRRFK